MPVEIIQAAPSVLDLIGLKCPLPALRTRKALQSLAPGAVIDVRASDPLSAIDIPNLLRETGDALVAQSADGGIFSFTIRKAGASGQ